MEALSPAASAVVSAARLFRLDTAGPLFADLASDKFGKRGGNGTKRPSARTARCRDDGRDQRQGEILRQELGSRHADDLFAGTGFELARSRSQRAFRGSANMPQ